MSLFRSSSWVYTYLLPLVVLFGFSLASSFSHAQGAQEWKIGTGGSFSYSSYSAAFAAAYAQAKTTSPYNGETYSETGGVYFTQKSVGAQLVSIRGNQDGQWLNTTCKPTACPIANSIFCRKKN